MNFFLKYALFACGIVLFPLLSAACRIDVHTLRENMLRRAVEAAWSEKHVGLESLRSISAGVVSFKGSDPSTTCPTKPELTVQMEFLNAGKAVKLVAQVRSDVVTFDTK